MRLILGLLVLLTAQLVFAQAGYNSEKEGNVSSAIGWDYKVSPPVVIADNKAAEVGGITTDAPVINFTGNRIVTAVYKTIENPTDSSVSFWFTGLPQTDSAFLRDYIWSKVTNPSDTEGTRLQIINACAVFLKNTANYCNNALIFEGSWNDKILYAKEHSLIGRVYSTYSTQCGNNTLQATVIQVMFPQYFNYADFQFTTVPDHAFTNTIIAGRPAHTDYDAGTCGFMFSNPFSANGWASTADIRNDTNLINTKYLVNGQDQHPDMSLSDYRSVIVEGAVSTGGVPGVIPVQTDGIFTMPSHAKVVTSVAGPLFFLDTTVAANEQARIELEQQVIRARHGCVPCLDTVIEVLQQLWPTDPDYLRDVFRSAKVVFYDPVKTAGKQFAEVFSYSYPKDSVPYWLLQTNSDDTLHIGTDVKMPLFVLEAENCEIGDTVMNGHADFPLWSGRSTPNTLTYKEVNYLQSGALYPGQHQLKLSVNANPGVLSVFNNWSIGGGNGLLFSTTTMQRELLPTAVNHAMENVSGFKAWLSAARTLTVSADCDVYNTTGQLVMHLTKGSKDVSGLARGLYVIAPSVGGKGAIKVAVY
jgi:hypothetical protein